MAEQIRSFTQYCATDTLSITVEMQARQEKRGFAMGVYTLVHD
ncbi:MAG: hypothetical protein PHI19_01215 [Clostridia bacterium]|nr:hypothetical protein [Clostridia bacterium]